MMIYLPRLVNLGDGKNVYSPLPAFAQWYHPSSLLDSHHLLDLLQNFVVSYHNVILTVTMQTTTRITACLRFQIRNVLKMNACKMHSARCMLILVLITNAQMNPLTMKHSKSVICTCTIRVNIKILSLPNLILRLFVRVIRMDGHLR